MCGLLERREARAPDPCQPEPEVGGLRKPLHFEVLVPSCPSTENWARVKITQGENNQSRREARLSAKSMGIHEVQLNIQVSKTSCPRRQAGP